MTAGDIVVRQSREDDVPAMIAIYTHHIRRGLGGNVVVAEDPDDIKKRRKNMLSKRLPHLVAEQDGVVIGYAYAVPFRKRPAYRYTAKHSIYVHHEQLGRGLGRLLLDALVERCAAAGYRQLIGYVDGANVASLKLHQAVGFREVGRLPAVAFKFGKWNDSVLMQRALGDGDASPPHDYVAETFSHK